MRDPDSDRLPRRWARTGAEINRMEDNEVTHGCGHSSHRATFWPCLSGMFIVQTTMRRAAKSRLELKNG
jgi:hypothetical protein